MKIAGLDYSITSPGLCANNLFYYWHKDPFTTTPFVGKQYPLYKSEIERVHKLADGIVELLDDTDLVIIEDYSFAASGRITAIAEGLGIIKGKLYSRGISFKTVAPPTLKKFATGSGRADKKDMIQQFVENTGYCIYNIFDVSRERKTIPAPLTDIADSYFLYEYGRNINDQI